MNVTKRFVKAEREKLWRRFHWLRESLIRDGLGERSPQDLAGQGNADAQEMCRILDRLTQKTNNAREDAALRIESIPGA